MSTEALQTNGTSEPPLVSVIIPSVNGLPVLAECVESFVKQAGGIRPQVVVLDCCGEPTREVLRRRFPEVEVVPVEGRPSIPALRSLGIARARGRMVAFTEDHVIAHPQWSQCVRDAYQCGYRAIGGPVENGSVERLVDWAVFFCEYARFMGPVPRGVAREIPGNNSAYDRRVFEQLAPELQAEVWEAFLHARMRELGVVFYSDPEMVVDHKKYFGFWYFLSQRYHYSRSFAGMRLSGKPWWKRLTYAGATVLLPGLLLARITTTVARKRRFVKQLVQSLPIICTFLLSWAVGEAVGALFGPGQSLQRVE